VGPPGHLTIACTAAVVSKLCLPACSAVHRGCRRYGFDPDELDEEQREREIRKRLNLAFKEFCQKVEKVAQHYDFPLNVDVPFRKSGFEGNANKEMVLIQPTTHCLISVTEIPFFVVTIADIDHVHFERVTYATKNFDLTLIFKDFTLPPKTITAIDVKSKDNIQDWLNLVEITYTEGPRSLAWNAVMETVRDAVEQGTFYLTEDVDGEKKPAGWNVLSIEESDDEEEGEDEDSAYSEDEVRAWVEGGGYLFQRSHAPRFALFFLPLQFPSVGRRTARRKRARRKATTTTRTSRRRTTTTSTTRTRRTRWRRRARTGTSWNAMPWRRTRRNGRTRKRSRAVGRTKRHAVEGRVHLAV